MKMAIWHITTRFVVEGHKYSLQLYFCLFVVLVAAFSLLCFVVQRSLYQYSCFACKVYITTAFHRNVAMKISEKADQTEDRNTEEKISALVSADQTTETGSALFLLARQKHDD